MHEASAVRGVQRGRHLRDDLGRPPWWHGPGLADEGPHIAAAHPPHRDEQHTARLAGLEDRDDVRVVHRRCGARLPDETLPERLVGSQGRSQDLERDRAIQAFVVRAEHHGHAALADLLFQQIAGDPRTGREAARHDEIPLAHPASPALRPVPIFPSRRVYVFHFLTAMSWKPLKWYGSQDGRSKYPV